MLDAELLPLRSDRAVVRPMRLDDAGAYAAGTNDAAVRAHAHLPEPEYTEESARALIQGSIREGLERGDLAVLTIADPAMDEFAGSLVLFGVVGGSVEVGFWVHPDHRGKGVSGAALVLAIEFARRSGFTEVTARTVPENEASQRVLARAGFARGKQTQEAAPSGERVSLLRYARKIGPLSLFPVNTPRLRLRLHDHADAVPLQRIYGRADVARYLLDEPWTETDAARHLAERVAKTGLDDGSTALALVIEHEGAVIGDVQLWLTDTSRRVAEIGWALDPAYGGQGFAGEAVKAVLELAFTTYGLHRVAAQLDARNEASARLAQRVGMQQEAHLRQDWWNKGEWTDTLIYGALSTDCHAASEQ
ncbi:GNAT family N-acetyltransferase [Streptomyces diastaticus]|uniref:GNAT family N-acetyltransferase n=1 Tax=Streptomyces diastaticus TaxID=1956 RepID=UPI0016766AB6|nr:GNAT family N-acetyltransferase [Streptomyces diastaticus]